MIHSKEIDMICQISPDGAPRPIKFRVEEDRELSTVVIDKVLSVELEKIAGTKMYVYKCRACIGNMERYFTIKYSLEECRWLLYKI